MTTRTYPRTVWVLQPSFKPKQVTLVEAYSSWSDEEYGDFSESRRLYRREEQFFRQKDAIAAGRALLAKQQIDLDKKQANIAKKTAALDKAEKELT